jgi:hypothetical protein
VRPFLVHKGQTVITTYLMGGMGNQMFQYAIARAASLRLDTDVQLNVFSFESDPIRVYSLGLWKGVRSPVCVHNTGKVIREEGLSYNPALYAQITRHCSLYGYWQTEKYFSEISDLLREEFKPKEPLTPLAQGIEQRIKAEGNQSVFLTVRRTDYTNSAFHGLLPLSYYLQAAEVIANHGVTDPCFFVFSDEPEWVTQNFKFPYRTVVAGNYDRTIKGHLGREDSELWLMRQCKHAILANSSYSWWGAWLNPDRDRVVVAPKQWVFNTSDKPRDIVPERWITI